MPVPADVDLSAHFDPLALGLVHRHSPAAFARVFGAVAARQHPPVSLRGAMEAVATRSGYTASPQASLSSDDFLR